MNTKYTIAEHWDPGQNITAEDDPAVEFTVWQEHARRSITVWKGDEFTLADFEQHIAKLKGDL